MPADDLPARIRDAGSGPIGPVDVDGVWSRAQARRRRRRIGLGVVPVLAVLLSGAGIIAIVGDGDSNVETDLADPDVAEADVPGPDADCGTVLRSFLHLDTDIVVYLEPGSEPDSIDATTSQLSSLPDVDKIITVHQGDVYDRFKRAFAHSPEIVSSVTPDILPIQLEIDVVGDDDSLEHLRSQELALQLRLEMEQRRLDLELERRGAEPSGLAFVRDVELRDQVGSSCDGFGREANPDTTIPAAPSPFDAPVTLPPRVGQPPSEFVAVTTDGRLVVVDTATGEELRQLAAAGDPTVTAPEEGPGPNVIDRIALSSDGHTVWYSECCEPVGGALYSVPIDGSASPSRIADGFAPSVSATSRYVAVATSIGSLIVDPIGGLGRGWADDRWQGEYQESAWSLDTTHLVLRTGLPDVGGLLVLDPSEFTESGRSPYGGPQPRVLDGSNWKLPSFRRDGRFLVAGRTEERWSATLIDPVSGAEAPADDVDYGTAEPWAQDYDASGEWLLVATGDEAGPKGTWIVEPDGSVTDIPGSFRQVSW